MISTVVQFFTHHCCVLVQMLFCLVGRLRLDESARRSSGTTDCSNNVVRRVPRMGTRLCPDSAAPQTRLCSEPTAAPPPADTTTSSSSAADITLDEERPVASPRRQDSTTSLPLRRAAADFAAAEGRLGVANGEVCPRPQTTDVTLDDSEPSHNALRQAEDFVAGGGLDDEDWSLTTPLQWRGGPAPASASLRKTKAHDFVLDEERFGPPAAMLYSSGWCGGSVDRLRRPPHPESVAALPCEGGGVSRCTQTEVVPSPAEVCRVMYTNRANLRHTIAVQQRLFRQQLLADRPGNPAAAGAACVVSAPAAVDPTTSLGAADTDGHPSATPDHPGAGPTADPAAKLEWVVRKRSDPRDAGINPAGVPRPCTDPQEDTGTNPAGSGTSSGRLEWVVRKRSDGSRYVTRRPVRSARCRTSTWAGDATTTTDDTDVDQQPALIGRYWTRDQRRQHVAERRRREAMKQTKRSELMHGRGAGGQCHRGLAAELAAIGRHRQTPLLSVATV